MSTRTNFSLLMQSVVESMTFPMTITDIDQTAERILIEVCDLRHAEPGRTVTIGGNDYQIRSIDDDTNIITLEPGPEISVFTFDLYGVHFFCGTPIAVGKELKDIQNAEDRTPMVFLLIPYKQRVFDDTENALDSTTEATLFCLTQANFDTWTTGDLQANAVRPMERLEQQLQQQIRDDIRFKTIDDEYTLTPRVKFGVYITNQGVKKGFEVMDLSGVQVDRTYSLWRNDCGMPETCVAFTPETTAWDSSFDSSFS